MPLYRGYCWYAESAHLSGFSAVCLYALVCGMGPELLAWSVEPALRLCVMGDDSPVVRENTILRAQSKPRCRRPHCVTAWLP